MVLYVWEATCYFDPLEVNTIHMNWSDYLWYQRHFVLITLKLCLLSDDKQCMLTWYPFIHSIWKGYISWIYTTTDRWHKTKYQSCAIQLTYEWLSIRSAGVTPVDVFSTVPMMRWTNDSCSIDHLSWMRLWHDAPRYRSPHLNTLWQKNAQFYRSVRVLRLVLGRYECLRDFRIDRYDWERPNNCRRLGKE